MEYTSILSQNLLSRVQYQYSQINENINKLIDDLGLKMQKQLINIQERALLKYKDNLFQTQNSFKNLKEFRSDEAIKENILSMKLAQQKAYQQSSQKSLQTNKIYDKLKLQFKRTAQYQRQLQLQLKFLSKQSKIAKAKSDALEQQIKESEDRRNKKVIKSLQNGQTHNKISKQLNSNKKTQASLQSTGFQSRMKQKIENLKQFLTFMNEQKSTLQTIFSKYDFESFKSEREKASFFQLIFDDKEFKSFIYKILFGKKIKESLKYITQ